MLHAWLLPWASRWVSQALFACLVHIEDWRRQPLFPTTLSHSLWVRFWQFSQYFHLFHYHICYRHLSADLAQGVTDGRALQHTLSFHQLLENTHETCCIDKEAHLLQESKADYTTCASQTSSTLTYDSQIGAWCSSLACMSSCLASPHWPAGAASKTGSSRCPSSLTRCSTPRTQRPSVTPTVVTAWPWLLVSGEACPCRWAGKYLTPKQEQQLLFTKQTYRHRKQTYGYKGERRGGGKLGIWG